LAKRIETLLAPIALDITQPTTKYLFTLIDYDFKMDDKLSVMRDCLGSLWKYALSAIAAEDIGYLEYIMKTGVIYIVSDLEAIEGDKSVILAKEILEFVQYVEVAMDSIKLKADMKQVRTASYEQETDKFQRDVDMFIDGLDSD